MVKLGDVLFFSRAKKGSNRKEAEIAFKGHGFGVFLGHVPRFAPDPPAAHLMRLMGAAGYVSFDDIAAFFGAEVGAECVKKFEEKYTPRVEITAEQLEAFKAEQAAKIKSEFEPPAPAPLLAPKKLSLVDVNGNSLTKEETE